MEPAELVATAEKALNAALKVCNEPTGWTYSCTLGGSGGSLEYRPGDTCGLHRTDGIEEVTGWRTWKAKMELEASTSLVREIIMDIDNMYKWNPALTSTKVKKVFDKIIRTRTCPLI